MCRSTLAVTNIYEAFGTKKEKKEIPLRMNTTLAKSKIKTKEIATSWPSFRARHENDDNFHVAQVKFESEQEQLGWISAFVEFFH